MDSNGAAAILPGGRHAALKRGKAASSSLALPRLFSLSLSGIPWGHSFKERKICKSTHDHQRREDGKPGGRCHQPGEPRVSHRVPWQQGTGLTHAPGTTCWPLQFAFCHQEFQRFSHGADKKCVIGKQNKPKRCSAFTRTRPTASVFVPLHVCELALACPCFLLSPACSCGLPMMLQLTAQESAPSPQPRNKWLELQCPCSALNAGHGLFIHFNSRNAALLLPSLLI